MSATAPAPHHARPAQGGASRRRSAAAVLLGLTVALVAAAGVWLTWRVFVATYTGQRVDQVAFEGADFGRGRLWRLAEPVLDVVSVPSIAVVLLAAVLIATVRRRWELAVQVAVLVVGANLSTQVLKHLVLDRPELGLSVFTENTLPSGHTTAAGSASAALVFVVPPRVRPWAALLGAGYTAATGISTLIGRWHRPSDVIAALLVVLAWSALACALSAATGPGRRPRADRSPRGDRGGDPGRDLPATAAIAVARAPGAGTARIMSGMLALTGIAAGAPAALALRRTWDLPPGPVTDTELLTGYAGGVLGVLAATCLAFAVLLVVREVAGRSAAPVVGRDAARGA